MLEAKESNKKVDRHYVDPEDHTEVVYLHRKFPWISEQEIRSAIEKQGPERKHIEDWLARYRSS